MKEEAREERGTAAPESEVRESVRAPEAAEGRPAAGLSMEDVSLTLRSFRLRIALACRVWPLVVLGPSGAGKSMLLRLLAGLQGPESGVIRFNNAVWFDGTEPREARLLPAHRRPIGYCLQDSLLFPHLSALANVAYPLSNLRPRPSRAEMRTRAMEELERWGAAHLAEARCSTLSGGEQSRVALARAFVRSPELLLLDEPFAALDPPSRETLLASVLARLREQGTPAVWVTHDRTEALSLGGTLAVLLQGSVAQIGPPEEVFRRPAGSEVAAFVGAGSVLHGLVQAREGGVMRIRCGPVTLRAAGGLPPGMAVVATIRSEEIELVLPPETGAGETKEPGLHPRREGGRDAGGGRSSARNELPAVVASVRPMGLNFLVEVDAGIPLTAAVTRPAFEELGLAPGLPVLARIKALAVQVHSEAWTSQRGRPV